METTAPKKSTAILKNLGQDNKQTINQTQGSVYRVALQLKILNCFIRIFSLSLELFYDWWNNQPQFEILLKENWLHSRFCHIQIHRLTNPVWNYRITQITESHRLQNYRLQNHTDYKITDYRITQILQLTDYRITQILHLTDLSF